ncbi:uncharacterized protein LOC116921982 isoform X2 [Daphnia magna]|uniref:uncharacterized protein LOC116921982 isoform X2 n=1 Tax=Daphnia magna TaxID=35525 RepID=UPI001E1BD045|nr:uncharacterized protein LOC116921982 isoform X2 [Daphnia magna]
MIKVLHTRNATFFDTCKARTANRKIMSKKKKRVDTIVELLSGKGIKVSKENLNTGFFPWHDTTKYYELIDTWMLSLRYEEAIVQAKKEMGEFIRSLTSLCFDLQNDIRNYEKIMPVTLLNYSRSIMATTEIARIRELMEKVVNQFTDALNLNISEDLEIEPEDFIEKVEKEEELLVALQEDTDEYSDEDNYEEDDEF